MAALAGLAACLPIAAYAQDHAGEAEGEDVEEIIVQATRSGRRVQDEPIRVDVITREEIEEKILMVPGNISMLVSETPGVRVQVTAPGLGASNVRIQGMKGRYTQILSDGLPLYGGQTPSIGLLQILPTDLGQVEVIKGAASALYGPSALGGVINLVSRRPADAPQAELLLNATSRNGQDATGYAAAPLREGVSASLTAGFSRQTQQDLNEDGWADMPGYARWTARPRLFWNDGGGSKAMLTVGAMSERRDGGTLPGRTVPDGSSFVQSLDSERWDVGLNAETPLAGLGTLHLRGSGVVQQHRHQFGTIVERDRHRTGFIEAAIGGTAGSTNWLAGAALQADDYRSRAFAAFDYSYVAPAVFAQAESEVAPDLTLAASARWDGHSEYGSRVSPRLSALYRPGPWTVRASFGRGFFAPTPFVEEVEANGLSRVRPYAKLRAEVATTGAIDIGYATGPFETNLSLFASDIDHAVQLREVDASSVTLVNAAGVTRTRGAEVLLRYRLEAFTFTASYVHVDANEPSPDGAGRRRVPLTPRNTAGFVAMWEKHGRGRVGFETYYTGVQSLDDNPFRRRSRPYVELGLMGELVLGRLSLFINAENLLNVRQTRWNPLLRPQRAPVGAWTVDAWAPTDGRVINGGVKVRFGGE